MTTNHIQPRLSKPRTKGKSGLNQVTSSAADLHSDVPPDWYFQSIHQNLLQRYWHTRRFQEVEKLIEPSGGRILDIGCADGVFSKVILDKSRADAVIGIDVLETSVNWANRHWQNHRMTFSVGDAHELDYESGTFDAVFALEVLEHVFEPETVLKEIRRVLKHGGYAVLLVPTDNLLFTVVWFVWQRFRGRIWKHTHLHSYKNDSLSHLARATGFELEEDRKFLLGMLHVIKIRNSPVPA